MTTTDDFVTVSPFDPLTGCTQLSKRLPGKIPTIRPDLLEPPTRLRSADAEIESDFDDKHWRMFYGTPPALDDIGIHQGHAWYRAEVTLTEECLPGQPTNIQGRTASLPPPLSAGESKIAPFLYIEHADDIIGVYVNGRYLTTVAPLGNRIDTRDRRDYPEQVSLGCVFEG
eukprot:jgi/Bigna1/126961/aug1.3_g1669